MSDLSPISPVAVEFVFDARLSSGDKPTKYGDKLSFTRDKLCSPEIPESFFIIFYCVLFCVLIYDIHNTMITFNDVNKCR